MPLLLKTRSWNDVTAWYRPNSSDERVLKEVVDSRVYRRPSIHFDVEAGDNWLDLGANIGAFAVYCRIAGATAVCYEPCKICYKVLLKNAAGFECHNQAVTNSTAKVLQFYKGRKSRDYYRYTCQPTSGLSEYGYLDNVHGSVLTSLDFDGVKMDIEGSEGGIIDDWLLPKCNKLCLEYHLSRDPSVSSLSKRLEILKSKFETVSYPAELDRIASSGLSQAKSYFDRLIFCMNPK